MENIKTSINGIDYILIDVVATRSNAEKEQAKAEKYEGLQIGVREVNAKDGYIVFKILIPEKNFVAYNNDKMSELEKSNRWNFLTLFGF